MPKSKQKLRLVKRLILRYENLYRIRRRCRCHTKVATDADCEMKKIDKRLRKERGRLPASLVARWGKIWWWCTRGEHRVLNKKYHQLTDKELANIITAKESVELKKIEKAIDKLDLQDPRSIDADKLFRNLHRRTLRLLERVCEYS